MKKTILSTALLAVAFSTAYGAPQKENSHVLWYDEPAATWTEALPIGNSRLGAMVFGSPAADRLQLNEETIWAGRPNNNANPEALEYLPKVRQLVWEGKYKEAQDLATAHVQAKTNSGMPYQPFGDLYISFPNAVGYSDYYRELSLDSARVVTRYTANGVTYKREYISSLADNVIAIHLTASKKGMITCNAQMTSPQQDVTIKSENGEIVLSGTSGWHEGLKGKVTFTGRATATTKGGIVSSRDGVLQIAGADEATIYLTIATNFKHYNDISGNDTRARILHYSLDEPCDFYADNLRNDATGHFIFDLKWPGGVIAGCRCGIPGRINVENSVAAAAIALTFGIAPEKVRDAIGSYMGVKRRFEVHINTPGWWFFDDYAHHPKEIAAAASSIRGMFPGRKITAIFQPHLYTRTRDFADEFAEALGHVDKLILLDIYPAREEPIPGVTSELIFNKATTPEKVLLKKDGLMDYLENEPVDVLITFGAGNIDRLVEPITRMLEKRLARQ